MLYSYSQCIEMFGTDRKIKQAIDDKQIFKIEKGICSNTKYVSELAIISTKYPNAIFTLNSDFHYYVLTDVIPDLYFLAISKEITKIWDKGLNRNLKIVKCWI